MSKVSKWKTQKVEEVHQIDDQSLTFVASEMSFLWVKTNDKLLAEFQKVLSNQNNMIDTSVILKFIEVSGDIKDDEGASVLKDLPEIKLDVASKIINKWVEVFFKVNEALFAEKKTEIKPQIKETNQN